MHRGSPALTHDRAEQMMFVQFHARSMSSRRCEVETEGQIRRAIDVIHRFRTRDCCGKRLYCVIDCTDFSLNIALTEVFAACMKQAVETYSITTVRYATHLSARATLRAVAVKMHLPSSVTRRGTTQLPWFAV